MSWSYVNRNAKTFQSLACLISKKLLDNPFFFFFFLRRKWVCLSGSWVQSFLQGKGFFLVPISNNWSVPSPSGITEPFLSNNAEGFPPLPICHHFFCFYTILNSSHIQHTSRCGEGRKKMILIWQLKEIGFKAEVTLKGVSFLHLDASSSVFFH